MWYAKPKMLLSKLWLISMVTNNLNNKLSKHNLQEENIERWKSRLCIACKQVVHPTQQSILNQNFSALISTNRSVTKT